MRFRITEHKDGSTTVWIGKEKFPGIPLGTKKKKRSKKGKHK